MLSCSSQSLEKEVFFELSFSAKRVHTAVKWKGVSHSHQVSQEAFVSPPDSAGQIVGVRTQLPAESPPDERFPRGIR